MACDHWRRTGVLTDLVAQAATITPAAGILVVDTDPDGGAADVVRRWADRGVRYVHEPRPGISAGAEGGSAPPGS